VRLDHERGIRVKLEGKVAIVDGGGQGIGEGIVRCLAEEGADIAIADTKRNAYTKPPPGRLFIAAASVVSVTQVSSGWY